MYTKPEERFFLQFFMCIKDWKRMISGFQCNSNNLEKALTFLTLNNLQVLQRKPEILPTFL